MFRSRQATALCPSNSAALMFISSRLSLLRSAGAMEYALCFLVFRMYIWLISAKSGRGCSACAACAGQTPRREQGGVLARARARNPKRSAGSRPHRAARAAADSRRLPTAFRLARSPSVRRRRRRLVRLEALHSLPAGFADKFFAGAGWRLDRSAHLQRGVRRLFRKLAVEISAVVTRCQGQFSCGRVLHS
jgi:hypothetical protein